MMKVTEAFEMFVDEQLFRNNSPKTLIWYRENLGAFFRWLGVDSSIDDLTIFNYKAYCSYLLHEYEHNGKPLKSSSVNSHVRCVKAFYNFCIQEDLIPDFSRKLKTTKVHKTEKLPLDDEEINLLLQSFGDTVLERRNFCWVVLMCDSGLRRGEILSLIMKNVDLNHDFLLVTGKGCKQRFVPLGQLSHIALYDYISRYRSGAGGSDPVFVDRFGNACNANTIKQVFQKLKKCTGIDRLHPHLLRHTFATNYLVDGGDLETLRLILGHSDLQVTSMYLHLAQNKRLLQSKHRSHLDYMVNNERIDTNEEHTKVNAKGLIAALILIIAEYGNDKECHIVSVLKLMIELLEAKPQKKSQLKSETYFADLIKLLPPEHKARWLSGAAINNADQAALSVISTALSRLNSLIDTETEQILCFNTAIDTETLCKEKCAVFIVLPEEDRTKYVIANLIIEQISREIYHIADENGGHLDKRIMIYFEEFGTMPPISGVEAMFSALRSRSVSIVAIIQSFAQLEKNYGKQGAEIIVDNAQLMLFGGFAPGSSSAEKLSKDLGKQTILTGSISKGNGGKNSGHQSQQLQMTGRELITADELKCLPKGTFICTKTGMSPFKVQLLFYEKLGIRYDEKLNAEIKEVKTVYYADRKSISKVIKKQHIDEQENEMNKEENVSDINELITDYSLEEDDIFTETPSSKKMIRT